MKLIPERILKTAPQWKFSLTRNVNCDGLLDELLYIKQLNPTGEVYRYPRVTFVPSAEREKVPRDKKLRCYMLQPGEFEPGLKERLITGVVVGPDGHPDKGAYVRLRYADSYPHLVVEADDQGRFTIPIFEGFRYAVQAELRVGDRTIYGELVQLPAAGQVKPLRLVIK
jgi:hypothetical protein